MENRIDQLRKKFRSLGVSNFLVTRLSNIRYLCGYTGSNGILLVTGKEAYFLTDGRYTNQANEQVKNAQVFIYLNGTSPADAFVREFKSNREIRFRGRVGIESSFINVDLYQRFRNTFPKCNLIETSDIAEEIAAIKIDDEINAIRKAVEITDKVFTSLLDEVKPGVRESDLSAEITYRQKRLGASKDAFEPIVASGHRSALPHGIATNKKIERGDLITFDFGCVYEGYPSDMTRTVMLGKASSKQKDIYRVVQKAQREAVEAIKPDIKCADIDKIARKIITDAGYARNFTHGLGHGLGLEVHALPRLGHNSKHTLKPGMVVTVEPGIYIDGLGGVRIEDDIVVTEDGYEVLNSSTRDLLEL